MAHNRMSKRNFTWLLTQCIFRVNMALAKANMPFSSTSIFFPRIYHWLKILTTGICLIFYWLLMTGQIEKSGNHGNPLGLFGVSLKIILAFSTNANRSRFFFQSEFFGYEKLVANPNLSHVMFLLCIAILFWVMDRQVRTDNITCLFCKPLLCLNHYCSTSI